MNKYMSVEPNSIYKRNDNKKGNFVLLKRGFGGERKKRINK
jgi:hypothetical protein